MRRTSVMMTMVWLGIGSVASASWMSDQLIYNVAGQVTNAVGARLGDEIYYGSSRQAQPAHPPVRRPVYHEPRKSYHPPKRARMTDAKRLQIALRGLGFYRGPIDGEVNSFETRSAIKELNLAYGISSNASLAPEEKDLLIYLGNLFLFDRYLIAKGSDRRTKGKKLQTALKILGYYHGAIDGVVGSGTRRAIAAYKADYGLRGGTALDFEEEYRLLSSAKEKNDANLEETIAALKTLGQPRRTRQTQGYRPRENRAYPAAPQQVAQPRTLPAAANSQAQTPPSRTSFSEPSAHESVQVQQTSPGIAQPAPSPTIRNTTQKMTEVQASSQVSVPTEEHVEVPDRP